VASLVSGSVAGAVPLPPSNPDRSTIKSFATHVQKIASEPSAFKKKPVRKPVVGTSKDCKLKSVVTYRPVDLFVSRLHPATACTELCECVETISIASKLSTVDVKCEKLKPKYEGLYASFHVSLRVDTADFGHATDVLMNAESWPHGVFVKRYFKPKHNETE